MKIGDTVFVHGKVDEIRKDVVIIQNDGGYFGTAKHEIIPGTLTESIRRINQSVEEVLKILDTINSSGRIHYEDYSELHDAISLITCIELENTND